MIGGNTNVSMGSGKDTLLVEFVTLGGRTNVNMGSGDDFLGVDVFSVDIDSQRVTLNGGGGRNDILDTDDSVEFFPDNVRVRGFEEFV